jgi:nitroimidazol reductase NimA-like FMN-containing flavoprotein (pyridoxamine 5'-phosphate oxidase superfamily)
MSETSTTSGACNFAETPQEAMNVVSLDVSPGLDLASFLARPLVARVAAAGPTIRPVWYLWEDGAFWWLSGSYSRLATIVTRDPKVALVVDTCNLETGEVLQLGARGDAQLVPFDVERAERKLARYLGPGIEAWDPERFSRKVWLEDPETVFIQLSPTHIWFHDLSYKVAPREL